MRKTFAVTAFVIVLLCAYTAWPMIDLHRLAAAIDARNAPALDERVNFVSLRHSLTAQVMQTYLKLTGKEVPVNGLRNQIAVGLVSSIADPVVGKLINAEILLDLLGKGSLATVLPDDPKFATAGISKAALGNAWQIFKNSEYSGTHFYIVVPPSASPTEQFGLRLQLIRWRWTLVGVDLPEALRIKLAEALIRLVPQ